MQRLKRKIDKLAHDLMIFFEQLGELFVGNQETTMIPVKIEESNRDRKSI